ncbi:biotin--[acetyl-CoA-carboxylase] ligase [Natronobiforma cellulositropha]|uniref:biotin--[acetyl-CoA-carboxylase] ligase n=1 Tax=Natronobiforma cellulositropha TaxID=1679076 RepID=UPI0021D5FEA9|nr:biotin--[acetyl-CoA-carboxylase] ligase [Natronobiforma cellulositropha]
MNETRRAILDALADGPVAGPALASRFEMSRAAIWKHVEALREAGFEIESGPDGYALASIPAYNGPAIEYGLEAPFSVEFHETLASTNDRARELAAADAADTVVVAEEMTGGRGRLERAWSAPAGGCWFSVVCQPDVPPASAPLFTLAAAVATARAARETGVDARIKWPNDVVVPSDETATGYRKLAGILTEMEGETDRIAWLVVGIGVNANLDAAALPGGATSIRDEAGDVDRRVFLQRLLEEFDACRNDLERTLEEWRALALTLGQRVRVERAGDEVVGVALEVTDSGGLVVELEGSGERVTVTAGDCTHLRPV